MKTNQKCLITFSLGFLPSNCIHPLLLLLAVFSNQYKPFVLCEIMHLHMYSGYVYIIRTYVYTCIQTKYTSVFMKNIPYSANFWWRKNLANSPSETFSE